MFSKIFNRLMHNDTLRKQQWLYKTEPSGFEPFKGAETPCPACGTCATHQSDYPSRVKPFARCTVLYCSACGLGFVPDISRETLTHYYQQEYACTNRGDRKIPPEHYFQEQLTGNDPSFEKYTHRVRCQIKLLKTHGATMEKVLDYGSGPGYFLQGTAHQRRRAGCLKP